MEDGASNKWGSQKNSFKVLLQGTSRRWKLVIDGH